VVPAPRATLPPALGDRVDGLALQARDAGQGAAGVPQPLRARQAGDAPGALAGVSARGRLGPAVRFLGQAGARGAVSARQ